MVQEGAVDQWDTDYYFVHYSLHEYFAAWHIATVLASDTPAAIKEMAQFIRDERDNPKYHMVFRFVAGVVSKTNFANGVKYFWDAVVTEATRNDDSLDLSIGRRVANWSMYIAEARANPETNPHLALMQEIIEESKSLGLIHQPRSMLAEKEAEVEQLIETIISPHSTADAITQAYNVFKNIMYSEAIDFGREAHNLTNPDDNRVSEGEELKQNSEEEARYSSGWVITSNITFFIGVAAAISAGTIMAPLAVAAAMVSALAHSIAKRHAGYTQELREAAQNLDSIDPAVVLEACRKLANAEKGDEEIITSLLSVVRHKNAAIRAAICEALGNISYRGRTEVTEALLGRLDNDHDAGVKNNAIKALAKVVSKGNAAVVTRLAELVKEWSESSYSSLIEEAAIALGKLAVPGDQEAIGALAKKHSLYDEIKGTISTTQALAQIATQENHEVIKTLFNSLFELKEEKSQVSAEAIELYSANERALTYALANISSYGVILTTLYQEVIASSNDTATTKLTFMLHEIIRCGWQFVLREDGIEIRGARYFFPPEEAQGICDAICTALEGVIPSSQSHLGELITAKAQGRIYFAPKTKVFNDDFISEPEPTDRELLAQIKELTQIVINLASSISGGFQVGFQHIGTLVNSGTLQIKRQLEVVSAIIEAQNAVTASELAALREACAEVAAKQICEQEEIINSLPSLEEKAYCRAFASHLFYYYQAAILIDRTKLVSEKVNTYLNKFAEGMGDLGDVVPVGGAFFTVLSKVVAFRESHRQEQVIQNLANLGMQESDEEPEESNVESLAIRMGSIMAIINSTMYTSAEPFQQQGRAAAEVVVDAISRGKVANIAKTDEKLKKLVGSFFVREERAKRIAYKAIYDFAAADILQSMRHDLSDVHGEFEEERVKFRKQLTLNFYKDDGNGRVIIAKYKFSLNQFRKVMEVVLRECDAHYQAITDIAQLTNGLAGIIDHSLKIVGRTLSVARHDQGRDQDNNLFEDITIGINAQASQSLFVATLKGSRASGQIAAVGSP